MSLTESKFYRDLSKTDDALLKQRALIVAEEAEYSQREIVDGIKREIRKIDSEIVRLEDIGRTSSDSLQALNGMHDASNWSAKLQSLGEDRLVLEARLNVATSNYTKYFTSVPPALNQSND